MLNWKLVCYSNFFDFLILLGLFGTVSGFISKVLWFCPEPMPESYARAICNKRGRGRCIYIFGINIQIIPNNFSSGKQKNTSRVMF